MKNHNHDLIQQLSEDLDSLWRYKDYVKSAKSCKNCLALWKRCQEFDAQKVKLIREEIINHVKEGKFD